jgi:hypothetical protein
MPTSTAINDRMNLSLVLSICVILKSNMSGNASKGAEAWFVGGGMKRRRKWPWLVALTILVALGAVWWLVPATRNTVANALGMKAEFRIIASEPNVGTDVDGQPLVTLRNFIAHYERRDIYSNDDTVIVISSGAFGENEVTVRKDGYASTSATLQLDADVFLGFFGQLKPAEVVAALEPTGEHLTLQAEDWVSGQPLLRGEFITGDRIARPNHDGEVSLLVTEGGAEELSVRAVFERDYLDQTFTLDLSEENHSMKAVPSGYIYTVSEGNRDIIRSRVDGSDKSVFIKATRQETPGLQFAVSPAGNFAVMASTHEGDRDSRGERVQKLYVVNLEDGSLSEVDNGYNFTLYDWSGNHLVYSHQHKPSGTNEKKLRLRSVEVGTRNQYELGSVSGELYRVFVVDNTVVYATSGQRDTLVLTSVGLQGASERRLGAGIDNLHQVSYQTFAYQTDQGTWNLLNVTTNQVTSSSDPTVSEQLFFATGTPQQERLAVRYEDGEKALYRISGTNDATKIAASPDLAGQIRFINATTLTYRQGDSLYAASIIGGEPKKVAETNPTRYGTTPFFAFY